jgi:phosphate transport system substrate-binding protein
MMVRWAEEYQKTNPGVRIDVSAGGAGKGATDALGGMVDIGMVSRDIHPEEVKRGGFWVPVVKDAVLPTANAANPAARELAKTGLTRETFVALWIEGRSLTWAEALGKPKAGDPIRVYTRSDACGAAETWAKYLGKAQEDLKGVAVYGDPGLAEAVQRDRLGVGFNNLNYAYDTTTNRPVPNLMVIPIDVNGDGTLSRSESFYRSRLTVKKAIADGIFPSPPARDLNLLTRGKPTGLTRDFLLWILGPGQKYVDEAGYIELPKQKLAAAIKKLK